MSGRSLLLLAIAGLLFGCKANHMNLRAEDFVEFEPASGGKNSGPVGVRVRYPVEHPVGKPLPVAIDVWSSDGEATELTVAARPEEGVKLRDGEQSRRFEGPVPEGEARTHTFVLEATRSGTSYVNVDVGRQRDGDAAHRTVVLKIEGGGRLDPLPNGGKKPAQPVRLE